METAKDHRDTVLSTYNKSSAFSRKQDLHQITGFKFGVIDGVEIEISIPTAWAHLVSAKRRIWEFKPQMAATFTKEVILNYFLNELPKSYNIILQSLDANPN